MKVVGGSASVPLARGIAQELKATYVEVAFEKHAGGFPDGERYVRLLESVADEHVVLVQTTHPDPMVIEFLLLADAIRDAASVVNNREPRQCDSTPETKRVAPIRLGA